MRLLAPIRRQLIAVTGVLVVAACSGGLGATEAPAVGEVRVRCGDADVGTPDNVVMPDSLNGDAAAAFAEASNGPGEVPERVFRVYEWGLASREEGRMSLFGWLERGGQKMYANLRLEDDGSGWTALSWNSCDMEVMAPEGFGLAAVFFDSEHPPEPAEAKLDLLINELACANGEAPIGRQVVPVVATDDERIVISVLVEAVSGDANCPGNPLHPITVTLDEPLGNREVFDGWRIPIEKLTWSPW